MLYDVLPGSTLPRPIWEFCDRGKGQYKISLATIGSANTRYIVEVPYVTAVEPPVAVSLFTQYIPQQASAMPQISPMLINECPACGKTFETSHGLNCHLSSAKSCKWYRKGKLRDLTITITEPTPAPTLSLSTKATSAGPVDITIPEWPIEDDDNYQDEDFDTPYQDSLERNEYQLIPELQAGVAGPSAQPPTTAPPRSRVLDDEDDTRYIVEHATAGQIKKLGPPPSRTRPPPPRMAHVDDDGDVEMEGSEHQSGPESPFFPFASELDHKVADWAITEDVGKGSFDRFLAIPGVCSLSLLLTITDMHVR